MSYKNLNSLTENIHDTNPKTLEIATAQIGVEEIPRNSNAGPEVEIYLRSVGLTKGYAWCMALFTGARRKRHYKLMPKIL